MKITHLTKTALMASITSALSFFSVPLPFSPVPVTGQTLGVMLSGLLIGPLYGGLSMLLYLGLGALGLPIFAGGRSGVGSLFGPSGGYLWGFVVGAVVTGWVAERVRFLRSSVFAHHGDFVKAFAAAFLGGIVFVHLTGVPYLAYVIRKPWEQAFTVGTLPFLPGDMFKALIAASIAPRLWNRLALNKPALSKGKN